MNISAKYTKKNFEIDFNVDVVHGRSVSGWIWSPGNPVERLVVQLYLNGQLIAQATANQFREDLLVAKKGDGHCAFNLRIPAHQRLPEDGTLELRLAGRSDSLFTYQVPPLAAFDYHVDYANAQVIAGWIWRPDQPSRRVEIDVKIGNELIGSVMADEFRQDLKDAERGDGHCAFFIALDDFAGLVSPCDISLYVRGVSQPLFSYHLSERSSTGSRFNPMDRFEYKVERSSDGVVSGWIWQPTRPSKHVVVDIKHGEKLLGSVVADVYRPDLQNSGKGKGHCAFTVSLDSLEIATASATISFHVRGLAAPFFSIEYSPGPKLEFNIDAIRREGIEGWIWNPSDSSERVGVELLADGKVVAETVANSYRPDLRASGKSDGKCAFQLSFPPSLADGRMHRVALRMKGATDPFHEVGGLILAQSAVGTRQPLGDGSIMIGALAPDPIAQLRLDSWTAPRCTVVAMARNEAHRAHATMRHFCALFDRIILIDHLSDDETAGIAAGYQSPGGPEIIILKSEEPGYHQSQYMTAVTDAVLKANDGDWLFYLDFDEFLPFTSKHDFHQALVKHAEHSVISGPWINCATDLSNPQVDQKPTLKVSELSSPYLKVGINLKRLQGQPVVVEQGNHAVRIGGSEAFTGASSFGFYHVPVLSQEQFAKKLELGVKAYDAVVDRTNTDGFHWYEMKRHLEQWGVTPQLIDQLQLRYGSSLVEVLSSEPVSSRPIRLDVAMIPQRDPATEYDAVLIAQDTLSKRLLALLSTSDSANAVPVRIPALYAKLTGPARVTTAEERREIVRRAVLTSSRELELVVPSAWAGHEPFLFSLMEAMRPRRYVELGTHAGQSFFAACQHYKSEGNYGEAVAIDLWEGDHQAGFYEERVFQDFRWLLNKHFAACGRYIRSLFSDAVTAFEDSSIDLLHIDGLHTYDAVRLDYETWRPKVTDCGVILFHDTTEYHTDFGVWQFFQEIRKEATASFNFQHSHGLGVMAFGTEDTNPALSLLKELSSAQTLYERHYSSLGQAMWRSARFRYHEPR